MHRKAILHLINEFLPIIGFFVAVQLTTFYTATSVLMALTITALSFGWYYERHLPILPIISGFFVIISGTITLLYKAPDALIFADSLYYFLMGLTIAGSLIMKESILKRIFGHVFAISDIGWRILSFRWVIIFLVGGVANEFVRVLATPEIWVNFKVIKIITITILGLYQLTLIKKYRLAEESNPWGLRL